jgi:hypothetical protein
VNYELKMRVESGGGQKTSGDGTTPLAISAATVVGFELCSNGVASLVNSVVGLLP